LRNRTNSRGGFETTKSRKLSFEAQLTEGGFELELALT
jgi:hypothetical protein